MGIRNDSGSWHFVHANSASAQGVVMLLFDYYSYSRQLGNGRVLSVLIALVGLVMK
jgi:hypothetical protein